MFLSSRLISKSPQVLTTFIIFSLSAGILGGIFFYMDSTAPVVLQDMESDIAYDMQISISSNFHQQNNITLAELEQIVSDQDYVQTIEPLTVLQTEYYDEETWVYSRDTYLGVSSTFFDTFPKAVEFTSNVSQLDSSSCYLEETYLTEHGLEIGDNYTARAYFYDYETYLEVEVLATYEIVGSFQSSPFPDYYYYEDYGSEEVSSLRMIIAEDALSSDFDQIGFEDWIGRQSRIWVSIDTDVLLEGEISQVTENLDNLRKRIEQNTLPYAYVSDFGLANAINQYSSWVMGVTGISVAFSIPSIIMGIMLVYYNSTLMGDERRKDVGTLKTRGASGWQAFNWILSSALITGVIGSLGAILTGAFSALLSSTVRTLLVFDLTQLESFVLLLKTEAIIFVFSFSFFVGLMVAFPIAVKAYLMSATEAHSVLETDVLMGTEEFGSPIIEILLLCITGYLLFPMLFLFGYLGYYGFMSIAFIVMIVVLMGIFVIAFTRLITRPTSRVKSSLLSQIRNRSYIVGTRMISRTVGLHKKSEALGVMFIAMVFTAGVFSSIAATTGYNHVQSVYKFQIGGDIAVDVLSGLDNVTLDLASNISQVDGVEHVCAIYSFRGEIHYRTQDYSYSENVNQSILILAVQPEEWANAGFWLPYFGLDLDPQISLRVMEDDYTKVLTSFKPVDHYESSGPYATTPVYGNEIEVVLKGDSWQNETDLTIIDVLSSTENKWGLNYLPGAPDISEFLIMDLDYVHDCLNTTEVTKFIVDISPETNYTTAMAEIWDIAPRSFQSIDSPYIYIDRALDSKGGQAIYGVYTLNVIFSMIYLTGGMLVVTSVRIRNLRKQISVLRALGTESKSITGAMLLDATLGILLALGIGVVLGLILSILAISMPLVFTGTATLLQWSRLPVLLAIPWDILVGIIASAFLFSFAATYVVTRNTLRKNIAEEIQYLE